MSISSALASGASALIANSSAMSAIADNIANANTTAYKRVDTKFTPNYQMSGGGTARYTSAGVDAKAYLNVTKTGLLQQAANKTDIAIDGNGFFVVRKDANQSGTSEPVTLTRSGSFSNDKNGYLVNDSGHYLYAWPKGTNTTTGNGRLEELEAVNLSTISGVAEATEKVQINANLKASQTVNANIATYNSATNNMASGTFKPDAQYSIDIFDSQGQLKTVTVSLVKSATPNQWHAELHIKPASDVTSGSGLVNGQISTGILAFDKNGKIDSANSTINLNVNMLASDNTAPLGANDVQWAASTGIDAQDLTFDFGDGTGTSGITQFEGPSALKSSKVDGAVFGEVSGVEISKSGVISARFTNGIVREIYQLPVATVNNPNGLAAVGQGGYEVTAASGGFTLKEPTSGGAGAIMANKLESSNVDIASEFSNLIVVQRAYSASSRIITTADEMLTEAIQMKR